MDPNEFHISDEFFVSEEELEEEYVEHEDVPEEELQVDIRAILTHGQIKYFREIFDAADVDKKGKIPTRTIGVILRSLGLNPSKAEVRKHIKEIDPDSKGYMDFYSFLLPLARRINDQPETHEDIIQAFRDLDEEENDYLTVEEATEYLTTLGEDLEDFEIELFLKMAETKGTGRIHYVEFVEKMMGITRNQSKDRRKSGKGKKGKKSKKKK